MRLLSRDGNRELLSLKVSRLCPLVLLVEINFKEGKVFESEAWSESAQHLNIQFVQQGSDYVSITKPNLIISLKEITFVHFENSNKHVNRL